MVSNSIKELYPQLMREWDNKRNESYDPAQITKGSHKKVWWKCNKCGYGWKAEVKSRVNGNGCPACSGRAVWVGHNDLKTVNPQLANEWNYEKNINITPEMYTKGSTKRVWWKCNKCGYEWENSISERNRRKGNCPLCTNTILIKGKNDLATVYPRLIEEWDGDLSCPIEPTDVIFGSSKKVFWKCKKCGFSWESTVSNRTIGKTGCPACSNNKIVIRGKTICYLKIKNWLQNGIMSKRIPDSKKGIYYRKIFPISHEPFTYDSFEQIRLFSN